MPLTITILWLTLALGPGVWWGWRTEKMIPLSTRLQQMDSEARRRTALFLLGGLILLGWSGAVLVWAWGTSEPRLWAPVLIMALEFQALALTAGLVINPARRKFRTLANRRGWARCN